MGYFDAGKEWEIAVLFLKEKDLIWEYREFHKAFILEEHELALTKLEEHYTDYTEQFNKFADSLPKKEEGEE